MHRQHIEHGQRIVHNLNTPLIKRLESRKFCGPYYFTPPNATDEYRSFYLDSDFMPSLRWQYCDEITRNIDHQGWYTDDYGIGDTIRGVVFRLPHDRGFLAGWTMGESMISALSIDVHPDEIGAAYTADSLAEHAAELAAEIERDYQREHEND